MSDFYKVSNSFRAKDKDGNPKEYPSSYGTFEVWKVYFEGDDTGYSMNKKPGFNGFEKGQTVYGTKDDWRFKHEQAPEGVQAPQQSAPARTSAPAASGDLEAKVDYLITMFENFLERAQGPTSAPKQADFSPTDIDDGPVDLSQIKY